MKAFLPLALLTLLPAASAAPGTLCRNNTGDEGGFFHTFWHDTGEGCMTLGAAGTYSVRWDLGDTGNLVAGLGWRKGSPTRVVTYDATSFDLGANGYLSLYGWSKAPLVEYYVVDSWGGFEPPGAGAEQLGTMQSDGGTYRIYRTKRIDQPSIAGRSTFDQYWSVRTERRPLGRPNVITFANHVAAWRHVGLNLGALDYQVLATEGFHSRGNSTVRISGKFRGATWR